MTRRGQGGRKEKVTRVFQEVKNLASNQFAEWCEKYHFTEWNGVNRLLTASFNEVTSCFAAGGFDLAAQWTIDKVVGPLVEDPQVYQVTEEAKQELKAIFDLVKQKIIEKKVEEERQKTGQKKTAAASGTAKVEQAFAEFIESLRLWKEKREARQKINFWLASLSGVRREQFYRALSRLSDPKGVFRELVSLEISEMTSYAISHRLIDYE